MIVTRSIYKIQIPSDKLTKGFDSSAKIGPLVQLMELGNWRCLKRKLSVSPINMFWCIDCKVRHGQRALNMNEACHDQVSRVPIKLFLHFSIFVRPLSGKMHRFTLIKGWPTSKMWIQNEAKKLHSLISEQLSLVLWGLPNERLIHNHILSMKWVLTYQGAIV